MRVELRRLHLTEHFVPGLGLGEKERQEQEQEADHDPGEAALSSGSWCGLRLFSDGLRPEPSLSSSLHPLHHTHLHLQELAIGSTQVSVVRECLRRPGLLDIKTLDCTVCDMYNCVTYNSFR